MRITLLPILLLILCTAAYAGASTPLPGRSVPKNHQSEVGNKDREYIHNRAQNILSPFKEKCAAKGYGGHNAPTAQPAVKPSFGDPDWWLSSPQNIYSAVLAVTAMLLVFFGARQARFTRIAAWAARDAAAAAQDQGVLAKDQVRRSHRPWISFAGGIEITGDLVFDGSAVIEIEAMLKNAGNSPALEVIWRPELQMAAGPAPDPREMANAPNDFRADHVRNVEEGYGLLVLPGEMARVNLRRFHPVPALGAASTLSVWLNGYIGYRDEFGELHATEFAFAFIGPGNNRQIAPEGTVAGRFEPVAAGWRSVDYEGRATKRDDQQAT